MDRHDVDVTRDRRMSRAQIAVGAALLALGVGALIELVVGRGVSVLPLTFGLLLIALARAERRYLFLVAGAILAGSGLGHFVADVLDLPDALEMLGVAGGFWWLSTVDPRRSAWARIPAIICAAIGIGSLGLRASRSDGLLLPLGVLAAGVLLLGRHRLPPAAKLIAIGLVVAGVLALPGQVERSVEGRGSGRVIPAETVPAAPRAATVELPELGGRTLVVRGERGSVTVTMSDDGAEVSGVDLHVDDEDARVVEVLGDGRRPLTVRVPPGTDLDVETTSGDITLMVTDDPTIAASSRRGSVVAEGFDADERDGAFFYRGSGATVTAHSQSGAIVITRS